MARTLFDPAGGSSARPFTLTAANAIAAGDLVVTLNGGDAVAPIAGQLPTRFNRDTSTGITSLSSGTGAAVGYPASNAGQNSWNVRPNRAAFLSNGNIVELSFGDGTTSTTGLYYIVRSPSGAVVTPRTQLLSGAFAHSYPFGVVGLTGGGFAWFGGTDSMATALKYGVISNANATVLAATALITGGNNALTNPKTASISALSGGGFGVTVWSTGGTSTLLAWVFNASGTLQGSQTTLLSLAGGNGFVTSLGASNGDFVIFADDGTNAVGGRLWRYTSAGAAVGTVQTPFAASIVNSSVQSGAGRLIELTGSNIVVLGGNGGASHSARLYNSSNAAVAAAVTWGASVSVVPGDANASLPVAAPISSGGFVIFYTTTSATSFFVVLSASAAVLQAGQTGFNPGPSSSGYFGQLYIQPMGAAGYLVCSLTGNSGTSVYTLEVALLAADFSMPGAKIVSVNQSSVIGETFFLVSPDRLTAHVFAFNSANVYTYQTIGTVGCSIFGVAQSSAAAGAQVVVATVGSFTYNQVLAGASLSFDRRSSTPFGNRGAIAGQTALLFGVQQSG